MDTNLGLSSSRQRGQASVPPQAIRLSVTGSAEEKHSPVSSAVPPVAGPPVEQPGDVSRLAKALVAEFDPSGSIEKTEQAVAKLNEILKDRERDLEFSLDETTGRTVLKVIHAETGEVIRQIPPEELLQIARTFIEGTGSLIDDLA